MIKEYDYLIKTLFLGDSYVGKSSIIQQLSEEKYRDEKYLCTIGVDLKTLVINIKDKSVKLLLWDTAGQERFKSLIKLYYRNTNAILLVFDITNRNTFNNLNNWLDEINKNLPDYTVKILIGNKLDIKDKRVVSSEEALLFSKNNGFLNYFEISAKNDINIEEIFLTLANHVIDVFDFKKQISETKNININNKKKKCFCF